MLGTAWLTLRQVRAALHNGRLEDARNLLAQPAVQGHRRSWELLEQLTRGYIDRAERRFKQEDMQGAWADLLLAEAVAPKSQVPAVQRLRQSFAQRSVTDVRNLLEGGDPRRAAEAVNRLRDWRIPQSEWLGLEDIARDWILTQDLADRGELAIAGEMFDRVRRVIPEAAGVGRFQCDLEQRQAKFNAALPQLHEALDQRRWRDVLNLADQVLAVAPHHGEARKARTRAWKSNEPETIAVSRANGDTPKTAEPTAPPKRFLLWIDNVGGFLLCLAPRVTIGQAAVDATVDVPLLADVSRMHATLSRDPEGYVLEAARPLMVNGQDVPRATLQPGDRITFGAGCQVTFQMPVPLSGTARLDLGNRQRLPLSLDGVILMAETLVLGCNSQSHVDVEDLEAPVVIFRHKDGLGVRVGGEFKINGARVKDRELLPMTATVVGAGFNFTIEPAGTRLGHVVK